MCKKTNTHIARSIVRRLLSLCMMLMSINAVYADHPLLTGGSGLIDDPYLVDNLADLQALSDYVNSADNEINSSSNDATYYLLTSDIDCGGATLNPIGNYSSTTYLAKLVFDGDNHTISNFKLDGNQKYVGLFGYLIGGSSVTNLTLSKVSITTTNTTMACGAIAGTMLGTCTLNNCKVEGLSMEIHPKTTATYYGGLVGNGAASTITNCEGHGSIYMITTTLSSIGGIAGYVTGGHHIAKCKNYINITQDYNTTASTFKQGVGGIVGAAVGTVFKNYVSECCNYGNIKATRNVGGIVGYSQYGIFSQCNNSGNINCTEKYAGGILGCGSTTPITYCLNLGNVTYDLDGSDPNDILTDNTKFLYYIGGIVGFNDITKTATASYPNADNLNVGFVNGWNFTGGIGTMNAWCYNNVNAGWVSSAQTAGYTLASTVVSGSVNGFNGPDLTNNCSDQNYFAKCSTQGFGGDEYSVTDKQISDPVDSLYTYRKFTDEITGSKISTYFNTIDEKNKVNKLYDSVKLVLPNWIYTEGLYAVPNNVDPDMNVLAQAVVSMDTVDKLSDLNHQFSVETPNVDGIEITSASGNKICRIRSKIDNGGTITTNIDMPAIGKDTIVISYKGMTRKVPMVINSVDMVMFSGGKGTASKPYIITCVKDLEELQDWVNNHGLASDPSKNWSNGKYFRLGNSITDEEFHGIIGRTDTVARSFEGNFDGNSFTITSVITSEANQEYSALFAELNGATAEIHDLEVTGGIKTDKKAAGICGRVNEGKIYNCLSHVSIIGKDTVGGIAAKTNNATITACGNDGYVSGKVCGGLIGATNNTSITRSVNNGSVSANVLAGGICGISKSGSIDDVINYGYVGRSTIKIDGTTINAICASSEGTTMTDTVYNVQMISVLDKSYRIGGKTTEELLSDEYYLTKGEGWTRDKGTTYLLPMELMDFAGARLLGQPIHFNGYQSIKDVADQFTISYSDLSESTSDVVFECENSHISVVDEGKFTPREYGYDTILIRYKDYLKIIPVISTIDMYSGGKGTEESPYLIKNVDDLETLKNFVEDNELCVDTIRNASWHKYYKQDNDLRGVTFSIGSNSKDRFNFSGFYDGNGNTISVNLNGSDINTGLFKTLTSTGKVTKVRVKGSVKGTENVGAIAGTVANGATIEGCTNSATITGKTNVGGLAGKIAEKSNITDAVNIGDINGTDHIGGIAGSVVEGNMRRCVNAGLVKAEDGYVGGLTGSYKWGGLSGYLIFECLNVANFVNEGKDQAGTLIGENLNNPDDTDDRLLFYDEQHTFHKSTFRAEEGGDKQELEGYEEGLKTSELTSDFITTKRNFDSEKTNWTISANHYPIPALVSGYAEAKLASNAVLLNSSNYYLNVDQDFNATADNNIIWSETTGRLTITANGTSDSIQLNGVHKSGVDTLIGTIDGYSKKVPLYIISGLFSGGNGTENNPYKIKTKSDMEELADYVNTNRLSLDKNNNWSAGRYFSLENDIPDDSVITVVVGLPNENDSTPAFKGNFEGHGYHINVNINYKTSEGVGLFGRLEGNGVIDSLKVSGTVNGLNYVGGVVGFNNNGTISNCENTANVTGDYYIGGITGYNASVVNQCSNAGDITANLKYAGGIGGNTTDGGKINGAVNIGRVKADTHAGGIVGICKKSTLTATLNGGYIESRRNVGGIAGEADESTIKEGLNTNIAEFKEGLEQEFAGSICGSAAQTTISDCYYDNQFCYEKAVNGKDTTGVSSLRTKEMTGTALQSALQNSMWVFADHMYPIPQSDTIALIGSSAVELQDDNTSRTVDDEFNVYSTEGFTWSANVPRVKFPTTASGLTTLLTTGKDTLRVGTDRVQKAIGVAINCITVHFRDTIRGCSEVTYKDSVYTSTTLITDSIFTPNECDTIKTVKIIVSQPSDDTNLPLVYAQDSFKYTVNGVDRVFYKDTLVVDTLANIYGCDSIVSQPINVLTAIKRDSIIPAECEKVEFAEKVYTNDTTLTIITKDHHDRDSINTTVYITVNHSIVMPEIKVEGVDSAEYRGKYYYESTIIKDTLPRTLTGCDSVIIGNITVKKTSFTELTNVFDGCEEIVNPPFKYNKQKLVHFYKGIETGKDTMERIEAGTVTESGVYYFITENQAGVDSIVKYQIKISHPIIDTIRIVSPYQCTYKGKTYTEYTVIDDTTTNLETACDDITRHIINPVLPSVYDTTVTGCKITRIENLGLDFYNSTTYSDTLINASSKFVIDEKGDSIKADSIVNYHVIVYKPVTTVFSIAGCGLVEFRGKSYDADTTITDTLISSVNCDSFAVYKIKVWQTKYDTVTYFGCEKFEYEGIEYTSSTTVYTFNYETEDSAHCLQQHTTVNIIIGNKEEKTTNIDSCDHITFRGKVYTESATVVDSFVSITGCDSLEVYKINVHKPVRISQQIHGCRVAYYNDMTFSSDTTFTDSLTTIYGCDSLVDVTVTISYPNEVETTIGDCYEVNIDGETFTSDTTIVRNYTNIGGCDSTVTIHVEVYQPTYNTITLDSSYQVTYNHRRYVRSTVLHDTLVNSNGCDSIVTVAIVIENALDYPIVVNKYNYMLLCNNNIGKDKYTSYQWYKDGDPIYGADKSYYLEDNKLNGCYQVWVTTEDGHEYFSENVCIEKERELHVYPNPVKVGEPVYIEYEFTDQEKNGMYMDVYNSQGIRVYSDQPKTFPIQIPGMTETGYYFMLITTGIDTVVGAKYIVK